MCPLSWNLGTSNSWNPQVLSRPVQGQLYLFNIYIYIYTHTHTQATSYNSADRVFEKSDVTECKIESPFLHRPTSRMKTYADSLVLRQGFWTSGAHARNGKRHSLLPPPPFFKFFCPTSVCILWICVHMHMSDCVQTVYEVPLLSNSTASATFLNKLRAMRIVDWIFINWRTTVRGCTTHVPPHQAKVQ